MNIEVWLSKFLGMKSGNGASAHWWMQRITAVALIPLTLFIMDFMELSRNEPYAQTVAWLTSPFNGLCMVLWVLAVFYHVALGLQVVIEDYIANKIMQTTALWAMYIIVVSLEMTAFYALVHIFSIG